MGKAFLNSSALFTNPSFLKGACRVVDLFGSLDEYNYKESDIEADTEALKRDWEVVGYDLTKAVESYEQTLTNSNKNTL